MQAMWDELNINKSSPKIHECAHFMYSSGYVVYFTFCLFYSHFYHFEADVKYIYLNLGLI